MIITATNSCIELLYLLKCLFRKALKIVKRDCCSGNWIAHKKKWRYRRGFTTKDPAVGFIAATYIVLLISLIVSF